MQITIKTEVTLERISDLLASAFEGGSYGSGYWCKIVKYITPPKLNFRTDPKTVYKYLDYPLNRDGAVLIKSTEDPQKQGLWINLDTIKRGLELMAEKQPKHWADFMKEEDDGSTADVFLQLCLFGDVIYG